MWVELATLGSEAMILACSGVSRSRWLSKVSEFPPDEETLANAIRHGNETVGRRVLLEWERDDFLCVE